MPTQNQAESGTDEWGSDRLVKALGIGATIAAVVVFAAILVL